MNKEQFAKFVQWLQTNKEAYANLTPDELVQKLNKLSETEEGQLELNSLFEEYAKSIQMKKSGGKIDQLINKFRNGGNVKKFRIGGPATGGIGNNVNSDNIYETLESLTGGDRPKGKVKNPNNEEAIDKALNTVGYNQFPEVTWDTLHMVADSLINRGYNPALVRQMVKPRAKALFDKNKSVLTTGRYEPMEVWGPRQLYLSSWLSNGPYYPEEFFKNK